jgi:hypothetical protein
MTTSTVGERRRDYGMVGVVQKKERVEVRVREPNPQLRTVRRK